MWDGCMVSGTADSVSGQLAALGGVKAAWPLTFAVNRSGTFFAHTAASNLYVYIFRLGRKRPTRILTRGPLRFFCLRRPH
jgi:hypothetical protein